MEDYTHQDTAGVVKLLQWGHGDDAVEDLVTGRVDDDGRSLQWGHGDDAVEDVKFLGDHNGPALLQWGHGDDAVEDALAGALKARPQGASMGPRR